MDAKKVSPHHRSYRQKAQPRKPQGPALAGSYGGFIRMSHEYSVERGSIENHRLEIERIAKQRGLTLSDWYILPAISGKSIWNHPEVVRLRADIEAGRVRGIVFTKLARVCRNLSELIQFRDYFVTQEAEMVCPEFDTRDAGGKVLYNILAVLAEFERDAVAERVTASIRPRAERGQNLGGPPKYGFRWSRVKGQGLAASEWALEEDPGERRVIEDLLHAFLTWQSYRTTARELTRLHKTRGGFAWSDSRVKDILTDPIYRGKWVRNRTTFRDGRVYDKDSSEWVTKDIPAIFTPAEAARIDAIIHHLQANYTRPAVVQRYLLTQITCTCGGRVYGARRKSGQAWYKCQKCTNSVPVRELDGLLLEELRHIHRNGTQIAHLSETLERNVEQHAELVDQAMEARKARETLEGQQGNLVRAMAGDRTALQMGEPRPAYRREVDKLQGEIDALAARIEDLETQAAALVQIEDVTGFLARVAEVPRLLETLPEGPARYKLVRHLIPSITLGRETIDYSLNFVRNLPAPRKPAENAHGFPAGLRPLNFTKIRLDPSLFHPETPFGRRLRWAREYLRVEQKDLAKRWGRSPTTLMHWEQGKVLPADPKDVARAEAFIRRARQALEKTLSTTPNPRRNP